MSLNDYRNQINQIDYQIFYLLERRMNISTQVGQYKLQNNLPIFDHARECKHLNHLINKTTLSTELVNSIWTHIFFHSKSVQPIDFNERVQI